MRRGGKTTSVSCDPAVTPMSANEAPAVKHKLPCRIRPRVPTAKAPCSCVAASTSLKLQVGSAMSLASSSPPSDNTDTFIADPGRRRARHRGGLLELAKESLWIVVIIGTTLIVIIIYITMTAAAFIIEISIVVIANMVMS